MASEKENLIEEIERLQLIQEIEAAQAPGPGAGEVAETGIRSALSGATLGLTEPVISAGSAALQQVLPDPAAATQEQLRAQGFQIEQPEAPGFGEAFQADVERRRRLQEQLPGADIAGQVAGAVAPGGLAARAFTGGARAAQALGAGRLGRLGGGAAQAGAGALAEAAPREAVLRGTGIVKEGEQPGVGEQALTGAALGAIPGAAQAVKGLGKAGFASVFGVRKDAVSKFLDRADELANTKSLDEISQSVDDAVVQLKNNAAQEKRDVVDAIQSGLEGLKSRVIDESQLSYQILEESGQTFRKSDIVNQIRRVKSSLEKTGTVGPVAKQAKNTLQNFENELQTLPDTLTGPDLKRIVQSIDQNVEFLQTPGIFSKNLGQKKLAELRFNIDQTLKQEIPAYEAQMERVRGLSRVLDESGKKLSGQDRAFNALSRLGKPGSEIKDKALLEFSQEVGIDLERFRKAQADADAFKTWNSGNVESKIKALMNERSNNIKDLFRRLSGLSDEDFVRQIENNAINSQFEQEFLRGSRNVNLWTVIGAASGAGVGGGFIGGAGGAAMGALIDRFGPKMAKRILEGVAAIRGLPTVRKIRNLDLPDEVKKELEGSFIRGVISGKREGDRTFIPTSQRQTVSNEIQFSDHLSNVEKSKMITELNTKGKVDLIKIAKGGAKVQRPSALPEEMRKPEQPGLPLENVAEFARFRRPKEF